MDTLVELYDERAFENVIGPEIFKPKRLIYLCPQEMAQDKKKQQNLKQFFRHRGLSFDIEFLESSIYKADKIYRQLEKVVDRHPDCVLDITGGTDAAIFAAGMISDKKGIPAITYSRKNNRYYDINHAPFADNLPCEISYSVEDFFLMAGGTMRQGRVDNHVLSLYMDKYYRFFKIFMRNRKKWVDYITFFQRISQVGKGDYAPLEIYGSREQKGDHGGRVRISAEILMDLEKIGFLKDVNLEDPDMVSFTFKDHQVRSWLRDIGSVLELYMYKACIDTGIFEDVISSAVVDWDDSVGHENVNNEIDVMASRGVIPLFISCKATEIKTQAINELAILRDRFGGKGAKAVIVTTEYCNAAARHRAAQLGIAIIDLEEIQSDQVVERLKVIMKAEKMIESKH